MPRHYIICKLSPIQPKSLRSLGISQGLSLWDRVSTLAFNVLICGLIILGYIYSLFLFIVGFITHSYYVTPLLTSIKTFFNYNMQNKGLLSKDLLKQLLNQTGVQGVI